MGVPEETGPHKADPRLSPFYRLAASCDAGSTIPKDGEKKPTGGVDGNGEVGGRTEETIHQNGHPTSGAKWSREELRRATADARDQQLAELVVLSFGLAAERHPDIIRAAIAKVFDLSAVEDQATRLMATLSKIQADIAEARAELQVVRDELKRTRK